MSPQDSALKTKIINLSDRDLLKMIDMSNNYTLEAIDIAQEEILRRGGVETLKLNIQTYIKAQIETETSIKNETEGEFQQKYAETESINSEQTKDLESEFTTMDYKHFMAKQNILKCAKSNFLFWFLSIILVVISKLSSNEFLIITSLIILLLMLIKSIKLAVLIKRYFSIIYEMYGPHPKEKRNSLITSLANIGIISMVILLFVGGASGWYIIPLIILSLIIFCALGVVLSGGK